MHPVSVLTCGIFLAGYITARWDLVTRLYELAIFAWDHGVIVRNPKSTAIVRILIIPLRPGLRKASPSSPSSSCSCSFPLSVSPPKNQSSSVESRSLIFICTRSDDSKNPRPEESAISAREQLRRRGSF